MTAPLQGMIVRISKYFVLFFLFLFIFNPLPLTSSLRDALSDPSIKIFSSEGTLLRERLSSLGGRRSPVHILEVSPHFLKLLIATEDRFFYGHPGVNPLAFVRAAILNLKNQKIVSGASTLTMQLARQIESHRVKKDVRRGLSAKMTEMALALYLEMALDKDSILEAYLNAMPFGNEIYGVKEASETYFRKNSRDLSLAESAYLLAIIRAPSLYNPYRRPEAVEALKNRILNVAFDNHRLGVEQKQQALGEKLVIYPPQKRFLAPHFTDFVFENIATSESLSHTQTVLTTLNQELNGKIESIVRSQLSLLVDRQVSEASVVVIRNRDAKIVGYVGSHDYWNDKTQGMNDGVLQMRQPGSTLKPFTYAKALDLGVAPSHVLADVKTLYASDVGDYIPENYDRKERGPVLLREALANSFNIPAVQMLSEIGVTNLYLVLKNAHFSSLTHPPSYYGLGLTLGNAEVSLLELTQAYSVFARDGHFCDVSFLSDSQVCSDKNSALFSSDVVKTVRDFLSDRRARRLAFGSDGPLDFDYPVMIKTGTSQGYRDNWTVAVTPDYTVGVWVGNFNADAMAGVSGVTGAAPIAHHVVDELYRQNPWSSWRDEGLPQKIRVCSLSGKKPGKNCRTTRLEFSPLKNKKISECDFHIVKSIDVRTGLLAGADCSEKFVTDKKFINLPDVYRLWQDENLPDSIAPQSLSSLCQKTNASLVGIPFMASVSHAKILSPRDGTIYKRDLLRPKNAQYLVIKIAGNKWDHTIFLDGKKTSWDEASRVPLEMGKHQIQLALVQEEMIVDEIKYWVK
jgi:penicillin-binding protein 1C